MTDRVKCLHVALEYDIREDDVEKLVNAIKCLRGVLSVETDIVNSSDWVARERIRRELHEKLYDVLR